MGKGYKRSQRVNDLIQTELAAILQRESTDLNIGMVTITDVTVSPDLSYARIFVSVLDDNKVKETLAALNGAAKTLRYTLAHAVKLRVTPELKFIYDDSTVRGSRISSLIDNALKNAPDQDNEK